MAFDTPDNTPDSSNGSSTPVAPAPNVTASAPPIQQQSSPSGSLQPPQQTAPAATAPPLKPSVPPVTATSPNVHTHSLISRVLGALAGDPPPTYQVDPNTGKMSAVPSAPMSTSQKVRAVTGHIFEGLGAGVQAGQDQKNGSGLSKGLAGLAAGFGASQASRQQADAAARKDANEDAERQTQTKLRQMQIMKANLQNINLYYDNIKKQNDMDPVRAQSKEIADAFRATPDHGVTEMPADAALKATQDPNNQIWAHTHLILAGGVRPLTDEGGNPVKGEDGNPKTQGWAYVIDGMKDGKIELPASIATDVQQYKEYGDLKGVPGLDGLKAGQELDPERFVHLLTTLNSAKIEVAKGWNTPVLSEDKSGNILAHNSVDSTLIKPATDEQAMKFKKEKDANAETEQRTRTSKATEDRENTDTAIKKKQLNDENALNPTASAGLSGEEYRKTLPLPQQQLFQSVAEGRNVNFQIQNRKGELTPAGQAFIRAYPDYDIGKAKEYPKLVQDFTTGPTSKALTSYGTAINHARSLYDNAGAKSYIPGTDEYKRYNQDITYVATEVAKALNPTGAATEGSIKEQEDALRSTFNRKAAIENAAHILSGKMAETKQRWLNGQVRPSYQPPMPGLSPEAEANAEYIRSHGKVSQPQNQPSGQSQNQPKPPQGAQNAIKDANGNIIGYN